jgi:excisionase family DNA binding protein
MLNTNQPMAENLRPDEAASYLRTSERTLARWRKQRIGPRWVRAGRSVLYRRQDLDGWLAQNTVQPVAATAGVGR